MDIEEFARLFKRLEELDVDNDYYQPLEEQLTAETLKMDAEDIEKIKNSGLVNVEKFENHIKAINEGLSDISRPFWRKRI